MTNADRFLLLSLAASAGCGSDPADPQNETESTSNATDASTSTSPSTTTSASTSSAGTTSGSSESSGTTEGSESTTVSETTSTTSETTSTASSSSSASESSGSSESSESTGAAVCGGAAPTAFVEACCALSELYDVCYGYAFPAGACEDYGDMFAMYGVYCEDAMADLWGCLSMLMCGDFAVDGVPADCQDEALAGHDACPELFPLCSAGGGGGGMDECEVEATDCLDGHTYHVYCMSPLCTCDIDGVVVGSFPGDADSCFDAAFEDNAVDNCGFPSGIFF